MNRDDNRPMGTSSNNLRSIPSIDRLLNDLAPSPVPRPLLTELARGLIVEIRSDGNVPDYSETLRLLEKRVVHWTQMRLQSVINATGIPLHTNLGRSPLSAEAVRLIAEVASGYCNLEFQIGDGARGSRGEYLERCLGVLCGCSGVAVVNNCAAALFLVLNQAVRDARPEVVISRGELVQIGGGFRIPDILSSSGAEMCEVGTTNRTTLEDYKAAITDRTGLILVVHRSNFYMDGFVTTPSLKELSALAKEVDVPLVFDQGSGAMVETEGFEGIGHERTVSEALSIGADLVCFSGDKLFGGPQAGLIAGDRGIIKTLKANPMYRALRCDKLTLSALQATTEASLSAGGGEIQEGDERIPLYETVAQSKDQLRERSERIVGAVEGKHLEVSVVDTITEMGGGTLPRSQMPSIALTVTSKTLSPSKLTRLLREGRPSIIGYVTSGVCHLDLRAVKPGQDEILIAALQGLDGGLKSEK